MYGKGVCNGLYTMSYDDDGGFFRILVQELRMVLQRAETKDIETDRVSEDMICHTVYSHLYDTLRAVDVYRINKVIVQVEVYIKIT